MLFNHLLRFALLGAPILPHFRLGMVASFQPGKPGLSFFNDQEFVMLFSGFYFVGLQMIYYRNLLKNTDARGE
jgi:hypothetical protein